MWLPRTTREIGNTDGPSEASRTWGFWLQPKSENPYTQWVISARRLCSTREAGAGTVWCVHCCSSKRVLSVDVTKVFDHAFRKGQHKIIILLWVGWKLQQQSWHAPVSHGNQSPSAPIHSYSRCRLGCGKDGVDLYVPVMNFPEYDMKFFDYTEVTLYIASAFIFFVALELRIRGTLQAGEDRRGKKERGQFQDFAVRCHHNSSYQVIGPLWLYMKWRGLL